MSDSTPLDDAPEPPNIEELLARLAPPSTPDEALALAPKLIDLVTSLDPLKASNVIAGLMTDPRFQAHQIRLDYALRIIIAMAQGNRRPREQELHNLLNVQLVQARVSRLEDPIEDFFVETIPTHEGEFLIFSGGWEKASIHTELILEAFRQLPDGGPKIGALRSAFALLKLSTAVVQRAELEAGIVGAGTPNSEIPIPSETRLAALASRVRFSTSELQSLGILDGDLTPFFLRTAERTGVGSCEPGDSLLEFRPLLKTSRGLIVGAPANISTAVRALAIDTALKYGAGRVLHVNLLGAKRGLLVQSNFHPVPVGPIKIGDDHLYCETLTELSAGRFLHVILSVDGFAGWPTRKFGAVTPSSPEWADTIIGAMRKAKATAAANPGFIEGMTLWICAGWGGGRSFEYAPDDNLSHWTLTAIEPADLSTIVACEDGDLSDIWRLQKQVKLVAQQGFEFYSVNGLLNLFQWWRTTDHALVPPQQVDLSPPISINFDTNLLLDARREAFTAFGRRALQDEQGRWHLVARLERGEQYQALQHVYASLDDVLQRRLTGVVIDGSSRWWVRFKNDTDDVTTQDIFETWRTVLVWIGQVMTGFLATVKAKNIVSTIGFTVTADAFPEDHNFIENPPQTDRQIDEALELHVNSQQRNISIHLKANWFAGFYRPDNYAERAMAVSLLRGACKIFGIGRSDADLHRLVFASAGSIDFRHRHAFLVQRAIDHLNANGLIKTFAKIPVSAGALAKCGAAWKVRSRSEGGRIQGKDECLSLILRFVENCQTALLADIKLYDRTGLVLTALEGLQSAIAEEGHWRRSARALRAIHGVEQDFELSLKHVMAGYGVLRANSMLAELAAVEALPEHGRAIGKMDVEELQARALQLFQTADNYPAFLTDRINPSIHISPTGDLLYQHDFHEATIERSAELRHARERLDSSDDYLKRFSDDRSVRATDVDRGLAILAEYGVPTDVFREFAAATAALAQRKNQGVMIARRSELITDLRQLDFVAGFDFAPLIDRLTLPSRTNWLEVPDGCTVRDFDLSKFDRRFSLIGRPIVSLSAGSDPLLAVAPGVIERSIVHNISGAAQGVLQNEFWTSTEMRAYAGAAGARIGIEFNESLARQLSTLGYAATPSVKPWACLNQKNTDETRRLGDIDVLAVAGRKRVWVCEAKDLKMCRTLGEVASRLSEYRGHIMKNGKPDKLLRHLKRVEYLRSHTSQLGKRLGLDSEPTVHGILIVNSPQPMQQLAGEYSKDSTVVMLDRIDAVPWENGW